MSLLNDFGILDGEILDELPDYMNSEEPDIGNNEENLFGEADADKKDEKAANGDILSAKKRTVRNPRPRLTAELLCGDRGIQNIEDYFKDIKFKGKGKEVEDLDAVMQRLQHWAHRLYPAYKFDDALTAIERLGNKRQVQVHMSRYRLGLLEKQVATEQMDVENDFDNVENIEKSVTEEPFDEFDALLDQQISISRLETKTPNQKIHQNNYTAHGDKTFSYSLTHVRNDNSPGVKNMSSMKPSQSSKTSLSAEQKAKIEENKRLAMERLQAKKKSEQAEDDNVRN